MSQRRRILFVDDDPSVLDGLKRMLRKMRDTWELEFAESGAAALEVMAVNPADVVVSDMRMPGMNGAQLLGEIKSRYPEVVRFVLSGHSGEELILRSATVAHQYLAKPCSAEILMDALTRSENLRGLLENEHLKTMVSGISTLPALPQVYSELVDTLAGEGCTPKRVGEIISRDIGMTAKMLQLINSAFFGLRQTVEDPAQAAFFLGVDTIKGLVLSIGAFALFKEGDIEEYSIDALHQHCLRVGGLAKTVAAECDATKEIQDYALTAGAIHDIGMLLLFRDCPDLIAEAHRSHLERSIPMPLVEKEIIGATHGQLGGYLLGLWGLPDAVVEAVAFHDDPSVNHTSVFTPLTAVHIAESIDNEVSDCGARFEQSALDMQYLEKIGMAARIGDLKSRHQVSIQQGE